MNLPKLTKPVINKEYKTEQGKVVWTCTFFDKEIVILKSNNTHLPKQVDRDFFELAYFPVSNR